MYQIEKGIPLPSPKTVKTAQEQTDKPTKGTMLLIAIRMDIGESVLFPTRNQARNLANQLYSQGKTCSLRTIEFNKRYRVWRTS